MARGHRSGRARDPGDPRNHGRATRDRRCASRGPGDLLILGLASSPCLPEAWAHRLHAASPWLLFLAAVIPAAVASLNGIRFQSECRRLAERSAAMEKILTASGQSATELGKALAQAASNTDQDPGAWILEAVALAEDCGRLTVDEVAKWSVLMALIDKLRLQIESCDAVIHIAGRCYGAEPRQRPAEASRRSYTQLEYDLARELGKPIYVFVTGEGFPADDCPVEDEDQVPLQEAHRQALTDGRQGYLRAGTRERSMTRSAACSSGSKRPKRS